MDLFSSHCSRKSSAVWSSPPAVCLEWETLGHEEGEVWQQPQEGARAARGTCPCLGKLGITLEGWRASSQSISVIFGSKRSWFHKLLAQLSLILISVKKFQPGLTSTTLRFHCEHFLQLFRVFCCCKEQLIWGTIIPGFKAYIHMAIKAVCNSIIEIIDDTAAASSEGLGFLECFFVSLLLPLSHQPKYLLVLPQNWWCDPTVSFVGHNTRWHHSDAALWSYLLEMPLWKERKLLLDNITASITAGTGWCRYMFTFCLEDVNTN